MLQTGLINNERKVSDWIVGGFTPLSSKIINPRGIWMTPDPEYQARWGYDRMACFPWNAEVLMEDMSVKRISEIKVGDYVISHLGNKKRVTETLKRDYCGEMFEIYISGLYDPIVCTPNHPILTNDGWKPACLITNNDYIVVPTTQNIIKDSTIYKIESDKNFLWFLGLYLAEGCLKKAIFPKIDTNPNLRVNGSGHSNGMVSFCLHQKETYLSDKIIEISKNLFNTKFSIYQKKDSKAIQLNGNNFWLRELLSELGGEGAKNKKINKRLMLLEPGLQLEILRGWLDGDGSYKQTTKGKIVGVSISEELIRQMYYICLRNGISANIRKRVAYLNHQEAYELHIYGEFINKIKDFNYKSKHQRNQKSLFNETNLLRKVKKIKCGKRVYSKTAVKKQVVNRVYNLEVEDDHSYIVNSVAVHNCVSYSLLNCLESLYYLKTGKFINFSDRFLARASGTSKQGNSMSEVFDTARNLGLVTEDFYPDTDKGWDEYYKDIPKEVYDKAKEFLTEWSLSREWVDTQDKELIFNSLYEAPLQVTVLYATGNGLLNPTSNTGVKWNHAVMLYGAKWKEYWMIFDHYEQVYKKYAWDYEFGAVLKPSILLKEKNYMFKKDHAYQLVQGESQKTGLFVENVVIQKDQPAITGLLIGNSIDVLVNSAMRLKLDYLPTPKPTTLEEWNKVDHFDMKGDKI